MATKRRLHDHEKATGSATACPDSSAALPQNLTSTQIVVLAAYLLGGERKPIDTEDLAIKAYELAPGRFCCANTRAI